MKAYQITQTTAGQDMGTYAAETPEAAIAAMLADAEAPEGTEPDPGLVAEERMSWRLAELPEWADGRPSSLDLCAALAEDPDGAEVYRVEISRRGKDEPQAAELLWWPAYGRGALAWGADATWTSACSPDEAVQRVLMDEVCD